MTVPIIVVGYLMAIFSIVIDFTVIIVIENMNERIDREEEFNGLEIMRKRELVYLEQNMQQTEALRLVRHFWEIRCRHCQRCWRKKRKEIL